MKVESPGRADENIQAAKKSNQAHSATESNQAPSAISNFISCTGQHSF